MGGIATEVIGEDIKKMGSDDSGAMAGRMPAHVPGSTDAFRSADGIELGHVRPTTATDAPSDIDLAHATAHRYNWLTRLYRGVLAGNSVTPYHLLEPSWLLTSDQLLFLRLAQWTFILGVNLFRFLAFFRAGLLLAFFTNWSYLGLFIYYTCLLRMWWQYRGYNSDRPDNKPTFMAWIINAQYVPH